MSQITLQANHCWIDACGFDPKMLNIPYGIYILGIRSNHEDGERILPFYVGETRKNVLEYLKKDRIRLITSKSTKWTIFSEEFLRNKRGTNQDFILRYYNSKKNAGQQKVAQYQNIYFGNDILYFNNQSFFLDPNIMGTLVPSRTPGKNDWPLSILNNPLSQKIFQEATLAQHNVFKTKGSFFFTPIEVLGEGNEFPNKNSLRKSLETYIKFSLKINTIGESGSFDELMIFLKNNSVNLIIDCPEIDQEFHPEGPRPTDKPTILFP